MRIGWKAAVHDPAVASFRFRVLEPVRALSARGHEVELFRPDRVDNYDMVVFCKSYRPADAEIARSVRARGGRVLLDLCDNHFFNPYHLPRYTRARDELLAMIALSDRLVTSTPALARVVQAEAGLDRLPIVIGDAVEPVTLPTLQAPESRQLLWFGSHGSPNAPSGMTDLLRIAEPLRAQAARTPFELVVASNDEAKFDRVAPELGLPARYVPWTMEGFPALLAAAQAVVIPLSNNPFVACKTHNRLSTALWAGVPVVADEIESYREFAPFAWLNNWATGLRAVMEQPERARERAAGARDYLERHWTMEALTPLWEEAMGLSVGAPHHAASSPPAESRGGVRPPVYQAALDPAGDSSVTGWARVIAHPPRPVTVTLEQDGTALAESVASRPRPDLAAVGFKDSGCGFELAVPAAWRDGRARRFSVVADGIHVIEALSARFAPEPSKVALPAETARSASARPANPARVRDDVRLQKRLADELERLDQAVEQVRSIAARIILAAGGGDSKGQPLAFGEPSPDESPDRRT